MGAAPGSVGRRDAVGRKGRVRRSSETTIAAGGRTPSSVAAAPRSIRLRIVSDSSLQKTPRARSISGVSSTAWPALAIGSPVAPRIAMDSNSSGRIRSCSADCRRSFDTTIPLRRWERTTTPSVDVISRPRLISAWAASRLKRTCSSICHPQIPKPQPIRVTETTRLRFADGQIIGGVDTLSPRPRAVPSPQSGVADEFLHFLFFESFRRQL